VLFPKIALCDFRRDAQSKNLSYAFIGTLSPPRAVIPRPPCPRLFAAVITRAPFARGICFSPVAQGALTAFVSGPGLLPLPAPHPCSPRGGMPKTHLDFERNVWVLKEPMMICSEITPEPEPIGARSAPGFAAGAREDRRHTRTAPTTRRFPAR